MANGEFALCNLCADRVDNGRGRATQGDFCCDDPSATEKEVYKMHSFIYI